MAPQSKLAQQLKNMSHQTKDVVLQSGAPSHPLATFAVFAFNQEHYIRATIEGALAQSYSPLEIILSDDCSSDRTFEIMQEVVAAYKGPHKVHLHRPEKNLGVVNHIITVAKKAKGKYLIVNAGDDISYPERTELLVKAFLETNAECINSLYDELDDTGAIIARSNAFPLSPSTQRVFAKSNIAHREENIIQSAIGFAASYRTEFWANLPLSPIKLHIEDGLATLLLNCIGAKIFTYPKSLIGYRVHEKSLSLRQASSGSQQAVFAREKKISDNGKQIIGTINYLFSYLENQNISIEREVKKELQKSLDYGSITSHFWNLSFHEKLLRLLQARRSPIFKFILPRLFGKRLFYCTKSTSFFLKSIIINLKTFRTRTLH